MDLGLAGKVAIVTGGSKGIGKAIAQELAGEGVDVAICARDRRVLEEAAKTLGAATKRRIVPIVCDTTSTKSVQDLVEATVAQLGRVDILVNNASTPGGVVTGPLASADDELLLEDINTKVVGYMRCAKAAAPHMQRAGWGRIVNIGGLSGRRAGNISGLRNAAIVHLTKTLADQLGASGITVNLVHPGLTRTERTGAEDERRGSSNAIRRIVDAREIAQVVTSLASAKAANITGVAIDASGGSTPVRGRYGPSLKGPHGAGGQSARCQRPGPALAFLAMTGPSGPLSAYY